MSSFIVFLPDCDLDFSGEVHAVLLHIVQFAVSVPACIYVWLCASVCTCMHIHVDARISGFLQLSLSYFQR